MFDHRDYQDRAIQEARRILARGVKRFIFQAPTGSGKTIIAAILVKRMIERGKRVIFAAHRRELILQPYKKFTEDAGIPASEVGVIKADLKKLRNPGAAIQIVSIQSVYGRALPPTDVVIIDECHLARSASYDWLVKQFPDAYIIGLTATPCRLDNRSLGEVFEEIVVVAQPTELYRAGYIVKPRMFTVEESKLPDLSGLHHRGGDFREDELNERVMKTVIMGSIVEKWGEKARGLRSMACCVSIMHSKAVCSMLNAAGIRARHIDGSTPGDERKRSLDDLEAGLYDVLCQVGLWIEGLDMPALKCLIQARPTESLVIHLQSFGRIVRPWNDVTPVMLDHAGNVMRLWPPPTWDRTYSLHDEKPRAERGDRGPRACKACGAIIDEQGLVRCPVCGAELSKRREVQHDESVDLVELDDSRPSEESLRISEFKKLWRVAHRDGFDEWWVMRRYAEKYGDAPPKTWKAPEREKVEYTQDQKRASVRGWIAAMQHNPSLDNGWLAKHYQLKFQESIEKYHEQERAGTAAEKSAPAVQRELDSEPSEPVRKVTLDW